jgi:hypothetical protein
MPANLRAKPIEGHMTDSAGNVLRNSVVTVKVSTPFGVFTSDEVKSDGTGYFITRPLPSGVYGLYESGIIVSQVNHRPDITIQCFKALPYNYPVANVNPFDYLLASDDIQKYVYYLQIEPEDLDISIAGSTFPIYDYQLSLINTEVAYDDLYHLQKFHAFIDVSRITTTRFDVEYFSPLTGLTRSYKRIRWAGVPGIRFKSDSKIVVPLDYMSLVPSLPRYVANSTALLTQIRVQSVADPVITIGPENEPHADYDELVSQLIAGDLVYVGYGSPTPINWYGVFEKITDDGYIQLRQWKATTRISTIPTEQVTVVKVSVYDAMFPGIININELANERFSVVENVSAQNGENEVYSYRNT